MIGTLIGAGLSLAGSIYGGVKAARERRRAQQRTQQELRDNENWYNRRYYEDATNRADANYMLTKVGEAVRNRNKAARGRAAIMGGTDDAVAAAQERNAEATADTAGKIVAANEARKDKIEQQYQANKSNIRAQQNAYDLQSAQNIAGATAVVLQAAGSIASALDAPGMKSGTDGEGGGEFASSRQNAKPTVGTPDYGTVMRPDGVTPYTDEELNRLTRNIKQTSI